MICCLLHVFLISSDCILKNSVQFYCDFVVFSVLSKLVSNRRPTGMFITFVTSPCLRNHQCELQVTNCAVK